MLAAMLPLAVVLFYNRYSLYQSRQQETRDDVARAGQLVSLEMQRIFSGMENVLVTLSSAPSVQRMDPENCVALLANTAAGSGRGVLGYH